MPELPEVELVKRELSTVQNLKIEKVEVSEKVKNGHNSGKLTIVKEPVDTFTGNTENMNIISLGRRGKYLYFILQNDHQVKYLIGHLGMSGAFFHLKGLDEIVEQNFRNMVAGVSHDTFAVLYGLFHQLVVCVVQKVLEVD